MILIKLDLLKLTLSVYYSKMNRWIPSSIDSSNKYLR